MISQRTVFPLSLSVALLVLFVPTAFTDTLILNNGNKLEGIVTREDGGYKVEFTSGHMIIEDEAVREVVRSETPLETFRNRHEQLKEEDPDAHYRLGRWGARHGLERQARREYRHAINLEPDHARARRALGFKKHNGEWMTRSEMMKEKGYVKYNGEWVTPEVRAAKEKLKEKREVEEKKQRAEINRMKGKLERSRRQISRLEQRLRRVRRRSYRDDRDTYYGTRHRTNPFFGGHFFGPRVILHGSRFHHRKKRHHRKHLYNRKKDGNTVRVHRFRNGELWKEIRSDGSGKIIHRPGDGHVVRRHVDRSKAVLRHHPNHGAPADKTLFRPRHHLEKKHHRKQPSHHRPQGYTKPKSHHRSHIQN